MAWADVAARISFPSPLLRPGIYLAEWEAPPTSNFADPNAILGALKVVYGGSAYARSVLDAFFVGTNTAEIVPTSKGSRFLDLPLVADNTIAIDLTDVNVAYLSLRGTAATDGLGLIIFHELLHLIDDHNGVAAPLVEGLEEVSQAEFTNPSFDHLGSVVSRTNRAAREIGASERGSYGNTFDFGDAYWTYFQELKKILAGVYDQAIAFHDPLLGSGEVAFFDSTLRFLNDAPSRDLVVALNPRNEIRTGRGDDVLVGYDGSDTLFGGGGNDRLHGLEGLDDLRGDPGNDTLAGWDGNDTLFGGFGADSMMGDGGADLLKGEADADTLGGGIGADTLHGDEANDRLTGGAGSDHLDGGADTDTAVFQAAEGSGISVSRLPGGDILVTTPLDGTDRLLRVEFLTFGTVTRSVDDWIARLTTAPPPPPPPVDPDPTDPPGPTPSPGTENAALYATRNDVSIQIGQSIKLTDIYPTSGWVDGDGSSDITWFTVRDRTDGGGFLTLDGARLVENAVYQDLVTNIGRYGFTGAAGAAVDEIGFNIIQADGDYSPSYNAGFGAKVTTLAAATGGSGTPDNPGTDTTSGGKADLVPTIVSVDASQSYPGGLLTVRVSLSNVGQQSALVTTTGVYLSQDATITSADTLIGVFNPGTLTAGETDTGRIEYVIPDNLTGSFTIGAWADHNRRWTENVESNNIATAALTIGTMPSTLADLEFHQSRLTKSQVVFGEEFAVDYRVRNIGVVDSARSDVGFYLSTNSSFNPDVDRFLTNHFYGRNSGGVQTGVPAGLQDPEYQALTIAAGDLQAIAGNTAPQNVYLIMVIDEDRRGLESDRSNNVMALRLSIADVPANWVGQVDHVAFDFETTVGRVAVGERIGFSVKVQNQGSIDAPTYAQFADIIWRSVATGAERLLGTTVTQEYVRGPEILTTASRILVDGDLAEGYYDVFARARTEASEPASLLANNDSNAVRVFFGSEAAKRLVDLPDLSAESLAATVGPRGALSGTATYANRGGEEVVTGTTAAVFVERTDGTGSIQVVKSFGLPGIAAATEGGALPVSLNLSGITLPYLAAGEYRLGFTLDLFGWLEEATKANNRLTGPTFVSDGTVNALGGTGADFLEGGPGRDTLLGADGRDTLLGFEGADSLLGGYGADSLAAGGGADTLNGAIGADTMDGGEGSDLYLVDGSDIIRDSAGVDTVSAGISFTLPGTMEVLLLTGSAAVAGVGNSLGNRIIGNGANNRIDGMPGNDRLGGGAGADTLNGGWGADSLAGATGTDSLFGGADADTLSGGSDADTMSGGDGADRFIWTGTSTTPDLVLDFAPGVDRLVLVSSGFGNLPLGTPFSFFVAKPGPDATSAIGFPQLVYDLVSGQLAFDPDGLGSRGAAPIVRLDGAPSLSVSDLLIIG